MGPRAVENRGNRSTNLIQNYERFYTNFVPPPLAPTYTPTAEEFEDPIAYVAKIRPEAEKFGVVKIIPPPNFNPPFAIDKKKFNFTPRVQRLNEVEALWRERLCFIDRLKNYWELQGQTFKNPSLDGKIIDLYKAHLLIRSEGGFEAVTEKKKWITVAKALGIRQQAGSKVKEHYKKIVLPFISTLEENDVKEEDKAEDSGEESNNDEEKKKKRGLGEGRSSMQGASRMMPSHSKKKKAPKLDPMADVLCAKCFRGDDEENLLLCEACNHSVHIFCLLPALNTVPKGEWRCGKCVAAEVRKMGMGFGFMDGDTCYTLESFSEFANKFKADYFKMNPQDVPPDLVEKTFWKKVHDMQDTVAVKYGADLITSSVGSGFPRKSDIHLRDRDFREYASHSWNLNNLPVLRDSVLSHFDDGISGVMVPWVYVGMCFSMFCWHTEDHWTYSINYNHWGERKIWYGISGSEATAFEDAVRDLAPGLLRDQPDLLHHMTTAVNPHLLRAKGVNVYSVHQNAGEFVITFPRAYHAGFNEGLNFAEAVNFAPIDWLRLGRACMDNYAAVRRPCVFSHDELVLRMVEACEKLTMGMAVAALEELKQMSLRESILRGRFHDCGVIRSERVEFEKIDDDSRVCRRCNTTLYMSSLRCNHGKVACLAHAEGLCRKCPLEECVLLYRHTLDELLPMVQKLKDRTTLYEEWQREVEAVLMEEKPSLALVEILLGRVKTLHLPLSSAYFRLSNLTKQAQPLLATANSLVHDKVRVRNTTRSQRADSRVDVEGVRLVLSQLSALPIHAAHAEKQLEGLLDKVSEWEKKATEAAANANDDQVKKLLSEADQMNVRVNVSILHKALDLREWSGRAAAMLNWQPTENMESDSDFLERRRWTLEDLERLIEEGEKAGAEGEESIATLKRMLQSARTHNTQAAELLAGAAAVDGDFMSELWQKARESDWCTAGELDSLRQEVKYVVEVRNYEEGSDVTLFDVITAVDACERSRVLRTTPTVAKNKELLAKLHTFTRQISALFIPRLSYFTLLQVLKPREDLVSLVEGRNSILRLSEWDKAGVDVWVALEDFNSSTDLRLHLERLHSQQSHLLSVLRVANGSRAVRATCHCMREKMCEVLTCLLCNSKTHGECAWWNQWLGCLPPGSFLCVRCLRSRRPLLEDVAAVVAAAPAKALECTVAAFLVEKAKATTDNALTVLTQWMINKECHHEKMLSAVLDVLGSECHSSSLLSQLSPAICHLFSGRLHDEMNTWQEMRMRIPSPSPPSTLFAPSKRGKSLSSISSPSKKKQRVDDETADRPCDHEECLQPYSDSLTWVWCSCCHGWLHVICTGEVVDPDEPDYVCYKCR